MNDAVITPPSDAGLTTGTTGTTGTEGVKETKSGFSSWSGDLFGAVGTIGGSIFSKPATTINNEAIKPNNNMLYIGLAAIVGIIVLVVVIKKK